MMTRERPMTSLLLSRSPESDAAETNAISDVSYSKSQVNGLMTLFLSATNILYAMLKAPIRIIYFSFLRVHPKRLRQTPAPRLLQSNRSHKKYWSIGFLQKVLHGEAPVFLPMPLACF